MKSSPAAKPYLHFLTLLSAPGDFHEHEEFDANHKALFESVVIHWSVGKPLSVLETISQAELGSPATLHKRLQRLIAQDFVQSECNQADKRTKFISPTHKGIRYMEWVGDKLYKSLPLSE
jgi:hypothetical protein